MTEASVYNNSMALIKLNNIYRKILGRDVDESGIETYLKRLNTPNGEYFIENDLVASEEYKQKNNLNEFNTLAGDRISYIRSEDTSLIDKTRYKNVLEALIELAIKIENTNYPEEKLKDRIHTVKKSLIHMGQKHVSFTIFPHMEYLFNTEKFNDSLKDFRNFQYYVIYMSIANIWKILFNKQVETCGTKQFVESLNPKINDFPSLFEAVKEFFINYLSIRISGRLLSEEEKQKSYELVKDKNSSTLIDYLEKLCESDVKQENETIRKTFAGFKNKPTVLVMIAYLETQNLYFLERMMYHCSRLQEANPDLVIDFALDNERVGKEKGDYTPWSRVKRIRNMMINKYPIHNYDYLYIIDSDIIDYPHNFLTRAIGLNPTGITAPVALIQNSIVFYDWCGYQKKGNTSLYGQYGKYIKVLSHKQRNFNLKPPYVDDNSRLVEIDCVGCTYVVPSKVFTYSYSNIKQELLETFQIANVTNHKINEDIVQYEDHPSFTDHFTVCAALRANGGKIFMDRGSPAYHADLPIHGEAWH